MNPIFNQHIASLESKYQKLINSQAMLIDQLPNSAGIYLFSESTKHLYVGRTRNIRNRIRKHINESTQDAPLAFKLARQSTGQLKASYTTSGSREELLRDPIFRKAYSEAKQRVRSMEIRFIIEDDPISQTLLEVYIALVLDAPYNDFDTH